MYSQYYSIKLIIKFRGVNFNTHFANNQAKDFTPGTVAFNIQDSSGFSTAELLLKQGHPVTTILLPLAISHASLADFHKDCIRDKQDQAAQLPFDQGRCSSVTLKYDYSPHCTITCNKMILLQGKLSKKQKENVTIDCSASRLRYIEIELCWQQSLKTIVIVAVRRRNCNMFHRNIKYTQPLGSCRPVHGYSKSLGCRHYF